MITVVVVEDHPMFREGLHDALTAAPDIEVTHAVGTLAEAMPVAAEADVVLLDLGLPDGSGLDLMRELSDRYGLSGIALSGYGMDEDVRKSHEAGFRRHLTKPIDVRALEDAIRGGGS